MIQRRKFLKFITGFLVLFGIDFYTKKTCFIGVGGGGTNIVDDILGFDKNHEFISINSDYQSLEEKKVQKKILLGCENVGLGCGGKVKCAKNLVDAEVKNRLYALTKDIDSFCVVSSLGGGIGSGVTPEIVKYLKSLDKKVVVCVTMPFCFEGKRRFKTALDALCQIESYSDRLIVVQNDDMLDFSENEPMGMKEAFRQISYKMYRLVKGYMV